jgi:hypothetical protein
MVKLSIRNCDATAATITPARRPTADGESAEQFHVLAAVAELFCHSED